jgi:hypothetical protein
MSRRLRDPYVARLATLFREHPAWIDAAARLSASASSTVSFTHLPGRAWQLVRHNGQTVLRAGRAPDPDFVFRFSPAAIDALAAVRGGIGEFALALFGRILEPDAARGIGLRIVAPFARLVRRGYLGVLLAAGPKVVAFGAAHGVGTVAELRRLVRDLRIGDRGLAERAQRRASPCAGPRPGARRARRRPRPGRRAFGVGGSRVGMPRARALR